MANEPSSPSAGDMSFSVDLPNFSDTDIVSFQTSNTHKAGNLKSVVKHVFLNTHGGLNDEMRSKLGINWGEWLTSGLKCEILKVGGSKGWEKGKVKFKIVVEFYPNEPEIEKVNQAEPSLDDIRLSLNKLR